MLRHCARSQLEFVYEWFTLRIPPLRHVDFTAVLPRVISLQIFSFLDPRSLSRAACVSWHWKFLTEQVSLALGYVLCGVVVCTGNQWLSRSSEDHPIDEDFLAQL